MYPLYGSFVELKTNIIFGGEELTFRCQLLGFPVVEFCGEASPFERGLIRNEGDKCGNSEFFRIKVAKG